MNTLCDNLNQTNSINNNYMKLERLADLFVYTKYLQQKTLVAVNAIDIHTIEAISEAIKLKIISGVVTGNRKEIIEQCEVNGINHQLFRIIDADSEEEAAQLAVAEVKKTPGSILMKGLISSDKFMKAILNKESGLLPSGGVLSHVTVIDNPNYHKLLIASDVAIIPYPTVQQKIAMTNYLRQMAMDLGIAQPKIALIAPTEQVLPALVSCVDAVEIMKVAETGRFEPANVYGPIALDVAIDYESAQIKGITSAVAGDADCLLFPNIDAGNVFYKMNTKLCNAEQAAVVMGATAPVVLSSRGDSIRTKLNSIALAALLSK
jgi:phosphate butyryltransferase